MTASKVVKEFLLRRVAPLQRHSQRMWAFSGRDDRMRLQEEDLTPEVLRTALVRTYLSLSVLVIDDNAFAD